MPIFHFVLSFFLITCLSVSQAADTVNDLRIDYNENFGQALIGTAVVQHNAVQWEGTSTASVSIVPSENTNFLPTNFYLTGDKEFYLSEGQEDNKWFYLSGNLKSAVITNADSTSSALGIAFIPESQGRQEGQLDFLIYSHTQDPIQKRISGEGIENVDAVDLGIQFYRKNPSAPSDELAGDINSPSEIKVTNSNSITFAITPRITQSGYAGKHVVFSIVANDNCNNGKSFTENFSKLRNEVEDIDNYFDYLNKFSIEDFINLSGCNRTYGTFLVSAGKPIEMTVTNLVSRNMPSNAEVTYYFYINGYKNQAKAVKVAATTEEITDGTPITETLLTIITNNGVTVSSTDNKIANCTRSCSASFPVNTSVTLNAFSPSGQQGTFNWTGNCSASRNNSQATVNIGSSSSTCRVSFSPTTIPPTSNSAALTVNIKGNGSVEFITADGARKTCTDELPCSANQNLPFSGNSTNISLISTANENSKFSSIVCDSKTILSDVSSVLTLNNEDNVTCTATFTQKTELPPPNTSTTACINEPVIEEYKNNTNQYSVTLSSCSISTNQFWLIYKKNTNDPITSSGEKEVTVVLDKDQEYVATLYVSDNSVVNNILEGSSSTSKELKLASKVDFSVIEQNPGSIKLLADVNKNTDLKYFWWKWKTGDSDFIGQGKEIELLEQDTTQSVKHVVTLAVYEGDMLLGSKAKIVSIPEATDPNISLPSPSFKTTTDGKVIVKFNAAGSYDPDNIPLDSTLTDYTGQGITEFFWNISLGGFDVPGENGWNNIDKRQHSNGSIENDPDQQPSGITFTYQDTQPGTLCASTQECSLPKMDVYYYLKLTDDEGETDEAKGELSLVRPNAAYSQLPILGNASLLEASSGKLIVDATTWDVNTEFYGGIFDQNNGTEIQNGYFSGDDDEFDVSFSVNTELEILAKLIVGQTDQVQSADLLVVLAKEDVASGSWEYWHKTLLTSTLPEQEAPNFIFKVWDGNPANLESIEKVSLQAEHNIPVYSGLLQNAFETPPNSITGLYHVFVGYRLLSNSNITFNGRSIDFKITE